MSHSANVEADLALTEEKYCQFVVTSQQSQDALLWVIGGLVIYHIIVFAGLPLLLTPTIVSTTTLVLSSITITCLFLIWLLRSDGGNVVHYKALSILQAINPVLVAFTHATIALFLLRSSSDTEKVGNSTQLNLALAALRIYPLMTYLLLRDTWLHSIVLAWAVGVATCIYCSFYLNRPDRIAEHITYTISTLLVLPDCFRLDRQIFRLVVALRTTQRENEDLAIAAQALELRAMVGNVAHDLKTPLTSFLGGVEFMREVIASWECTLNTPDFSAKAAENFTALKHCLRTMEGTNSFMTMSINRLMDYTKASKGVKLLPKLETVCLVDEVDFAVQLIRDMNCSIAVQIRPPDGDICSHIITDKQWLVENLLCLLSNAAKFATRGKVDVSVKLQIPADAAANAEPFLRFEVQDTGIGLSEEAKANLFAPFQQAQRLVGGTGLGLFSLAMRVEALQGQYGVCKRPDGAQGSLFWFTIPYRPDAMMSAQTAGAESGGMLSQSKASECGVPPFQPCPSQPSCSVLVVDDAPMIVKMTSMLLTRKGHAVQHAVNGAEALEKIQQGCDDRHKPFDVVLMDLQMPVLDGIEAIRRLRNKEHSWVEGRQANDTKDSQEVGNDSPRPAQPHQFVIALSANSDEGTREEALAAGADAFISKPFKYETFQFELGRKTAGSGD